MARPAQATESVHSQFRNCANSNRSSATGTASAPCRILLRANVETQEADAAANREDKSHERLATNIAEFWQYAVLRSYLDHTDTAQSSAASSSTAPRQQPLEASPRAWSTQAPLFEERAWNYIRIPMQVFLNLLHAGTYCNDIVDQLYDVSALQLHKHLWDVMKCDKEGRLKDNNFVEWCRKVNELCEGWRPNATEHERNASRHDIRNMQPFNKNQAIQSCEEWYRNRLVPHMLRYDTTQEQRQSERYRIQQNGRITSNQKSWAHVVLRKNLGDARTVFFIFHHGIPQMLQASYRTTLSVDACEFSRIFSEFIQWHASLLLSLVNHKNLYEHQVAKYKWQEQKIEEAGIARDRIIKGFYIATGSTFGDGISQKHRQLLKDIVDAQDETQYGTANAPKARPFVGARFPAR